ncbi:beta-1,3-galactosyltransferase 5 isoform X2 [Diachasmimorpha longicaudata]|uniref:beta-1,3-galactosyltransferase 5 isoform X2 n=1 Tax=Diachasmimorpha longicaudata TaxID=58733 RepID=UPI0030B89F4E
MRRSLKFRRHVLQIFIFGFFILTLYWYHQAIMNYISSVAVLHTKSGKKWTDNRYIGSRSRATFSSTSELLQHSVTTSRTEPTSSSAPQTLQHSTNASTSFFSNNPIYQSFTTSGTNSTVISESDTIRAIYQSGHAVTAQGKCPNYGEDMDLIIVITSAPSHTEARTAIRKSWGLLGQRTNVSVVFILGMTGDPKLESHLQREQKLYGDMIRGQFLDSYFNLTLKTISMLEWIDTYCPRANFILKTDDDVFINMPQLLSFVKKHETDRNVVFGKLAHKWRPFRDPKSKYFVSRNEYKNRLYPNFMSGPAYLLSSDVINKLYKTALNENFFKLEDVFITGMVASKLQINLRHAFEFLNVNVAYSPCNVQRVISIHEVKPGDQARLWKMLSDTNTNCILT